MQASWENLWQNLQNQIKDDFTKRGTILSFEEYVQLMWKQPTKHLRNSAQYIKDVFEHYGVDIVKTPVGRLKRFKLFDAPFGEAQERVTGQELVQETIYQIISNFEREGRINKLLMLHGPNGSAKSLILKAIMSAIESYALLDDGVAYSFNWIFPSEKIVYDSIGFSTQSGRKLPKESFAFLSSEQIDARVPCELHDHPIFLIPIEERSEIITRMMEQGLIPENFKLSDYIRQGDLCPKCRKIYDAMLANYEGDLGQLLRHIQIERLYLSRRYRRGAVTVEPQIAADAHFQQITADRSIASLPRNLQHLALFEPSGPMVDANRGILEFSDMLKRPVEHFKYLLSTIENATIAMDSLILHLDTILMATTNDKYLDAFKAHPDFPSFKGRIELIRVPYLRRFDQAIEVYKTRITDTIVGNHIAPHAIDVAAMWAVLTRLMPTDKDAEYPKDISKIVKNLLPLEKLHLYNSGITPEGLTNQETKEMQSIIPDIYKQYDSEEVYEGCMGASAREIRTLLLNASLHEDHACLHPLSVFEELRTLAKQQSIYEFLRIEEHKGYHAPIKFIDQVQEQYLNWIDKEIQTATGLAEEKSYAELFNKYMQHISHWTKNEQILDPISGDYINPDHNLMEDIEKVIKPTSEDSDKFRKSLISKVGAYALENPDVQGTIFEEILPHYVSLLRDDFFMRRRNTVKKLAENLLEYISRLQSDEKAALDIYNKKQQQQYHDMLTILYEKFGYCPQCAKDTIAFCIKHRYE